jgi:hypothetical protein
VERKYGKARRVWVFDRGIISEENLAALRKRGGHYLVETARRKLKEFERELLEGGWQQLRPSVRSKVKCQFVRFSQSRRSPTITNRRGRNIYRHSARTLGRRSYGANTDLR